MVFVKPFKALRPKVEMISKVNSPPYDIVSQEEASLIVRDNPYSFLKVVKPEANLIGEQSLSSLQLSEIAAKNLQSLIKQGVMQKEEQECFYLYHQDNGIYQRTGLVACLSVEDYLKGIVKKHEKTNIEPLQGRINHIKSTNAHTGCILIIYKGNRYIDELINGEVNNKEPLYNFKSDDGVENRCWQIKEKKNILLLEEAFQHVTSLYIADGHHRAAAAAEVARLIKSKDSKDKKNALRKTEEYMYFPAVLIPHDQIHISAYHRAVKIFPEFVEADFVQKVSELFQIEKIDGNTPFLPINKHQFGMNISGQWYKLLFTRDYFNEKRKGAASLLDVSILQDLILHPLLGIENPQKNDRIEFIGGDKNALLKIEEKVKQGSYIVFTLFPTSVEEVIEISDMEQVMPPKSTWFEPKVRSGVFVHLFN